LIIEFFIGMTEVNHVSQDVTSFWDHQ